MPDTRVIYSQTTVPEPRVIMEPKTVTVQVPKTVMEPVEYTVQEPRTVMDEKNITVPKIILEDQEITVPVPRAVQVPVQRMVPRTVMVPITTYVTQYVQETEKVRNLRTGQSLSYCKFAESNLHRNGEIAIDESNSALLCSASSRCPRLWQKTRRSKFPGKCWSRAGSQYSDQRSKWKTGRSQCRSPRPSRCHVWYQWLRLSKASAWWKLRAW